MQAVLDTIRDGTEHELIIKIWLIEQALLPTERQLYQIICEKFFADQELVGLPELLSNRKSQIRRPELLSLLWPLHFRLLKFVCTTISPNQALHPIDEYLRTKQDNYLRLQESFAAFNEIDRTREDSEDLIDQMAANSVSVILQALLIREYSGDSKHHGRAWNGLSSGFPELYVNQLEKLLYQDWYVACFVAEPNQAAMWSTYGDGHKGVCLKFKTHLDSSNKPSLSLLQMVAAKMNSSGTTPMYGYRDSTLQEVKYRDKYQEINFFRSLGRLTREQLKFWFLDKEGAVSTIGLEVLSGTEEWRQEYKLSFDNTIITKLADWQHEKEYRIALHSPVLNLFSTLSRKIKYRFEDLQGIIFGIKTSTQDKIEIIRLIEAKCKQERRQKFEFH